MIKFIKMRCRLGIIVPGKLGISECQVMSSRGGHSNPFANDVKSNVKRKKLNNLTCGNPFNRDLNPGEKRFGYCIHCIKSVL